MLEGDDKKIRRMVDRASKDLRRSAQLLDDRRINWHHVAAPRINRHFEQLHRDSQRAGLLFKFNGDYEDAPNEERIQLRAQQSFTGIFNRKHKDPWEDGPPHVDTPVWETGGVLVATQAITGHVFFTVTPRESDRSTPHTSELIIMGPLDPSDVSDRRLRKVIARYLLLLKASSNVGWDSLSVRERIAYQWMYAIELRSRQDIMRAGIKFFRGESLRVFVGGVFTALGAVWLASLGLKAS